MTIRSMLFGAALAATASVTGSARADSDPVAPTATAVNGSPSKYEKARFSGRRLFVEMLAGGAVGSLAGYLGYKAAGGDGIGAAFAGSGAEILVTPFVVYGTGRAMGGQGTLGWTFTGGLAAFTGPAATPSDATTSLALGMLLMPVTSALMYEMSSHFRSKVFERIAGGLSIAPIVHQQGVGARAGIGFRF